MDVTPDTDESSQDDSDDENELSVAYDKLFEECTKLKKFNKRSFKNLNEDEKKNLLAKLDKLNALLEKSKLENFL